METGPEARVGCATYSLTPHVHQHTKANALTGTPVAHYANGVDRSQREIKLIVRRRAVGVRTIYRVCLCGHGAKNTASVCIERTGARMYLVIAWQCDHCRQEERGEAFPSGTAHDFRD